MGIWYSCFHMPALNLKCLDHANKCLLTERERDRLDFFFFFEPDILTLNLETVHVPLFRNNRERCYSYCST